MKQNNVRSSKNLKLITENRIKSNKFKCYKKYSRNKDKQSINELKINYYLHITYKTIELSQIKYIKMV